MPATSGTLSGRPGTGSSITPAGAMRPSAEGATTRKSGSSAQPTEYSPARSAGMGWADGILSYPMGSYGIGLG